MPNVVSINDMLVHINATILKVHGGGAILIKKI